MTSHVVHGRFPYLSTLYFSKMDIEKTMEDLQAQNSQFQETLLTLAKGQQELMTLLASKKKPKRKALVNMGKRFRETICQMPIVEDSSEEDENQVQDARSTRAGCVNDRVSDDEDYFDEQYPPADDKYKKLVDRLKAVEILSHSWFRF